jgi:HAD superfamily hydrolase (TIGR01450 family)
VTAPKADLLRGSERAILDGCTLLVADLDGVVYLGADPVEHAASAFAAVREREIAVRFVTNNASKPPAAVAAALRELGVDATPEEIVTSAVVAATVLAERLPAGAPVLAVGGDGVREALAAAGLRPVATAAEQPVAVLQGFAPEVGWAMLAEAMVAIRAGASWMATNLDRTLPSPRGPLPGNGSLVAALATATGCRPESVGKPAPTLYTAALAGRPPGDALAVGDRLDTDIAGARTAGLPSLLVLTGVTDAMELLAAAHEVRPDYIGADLRALFRPHPAARVDGGEGVCGTARIRATGRGLELVAADGGADGLDPLRALCALAWSRGRVADEAGRAPYHRVLSQLGLD